METGTCKTEGAPYIFFVKPGPSHSLVDIEPHAEALGRRFAGELWTYGSYAADILHNQFRLRVLPLGNRGSVGVYARFWRAVTQRSAELRDSGFTRIVVIAYDPLKTGLLALRAARLLRSPLVCEVNGTFGDPELLADFSSGWKRRLRQWESSLLGRYVLARTDCVKLLFDDQLANFWSPGPDALVRRFMDITYVDRFFTAPEEPYILMVGFPFKLKGADLLFRAFARIADRYPDWRLIMIGHQLAQGMQREGLSHPRVQVLPGMPQPELADWISRCAIIAQPSRTEAMGRVLVESAVAGKCRVASRVNGIPTVIDHGRDGILVPKNDVPALSDALAELMQDPESRARLGAAARERALREFTVDHYLDCYDELLRSVADRADRP